MITIKKLIADAVDAELAATPLGIDQLKAAALACIEGDPWFSTDSYMPDSKCMLPQDKTFITAATPATILALLERLQAAEDAAKDAERWRETLMHVGGMYTDCGAQRFTLRYLSPIESEDILKGSAAGHFTASIDAAIAARRLTP